MFKDQELHDSLSRMHVQLVGKGNIVEKKLDEIREILIRLVGDVQQVKTSQRADKKRDTKNE